MRNVLVFLKIKYFFLEEYILYINTASLCLEVQILSEAFLFQVSKARKREHC